MADSTQPRSGDFYRSKANGDILCVIAMGTGLIDPCRLRVVELGKSHLQELEAWSEMGPQYVCGDHGLADMQRELNKLPTQAERLTWLVEHAKSRETHVEPAWFEHAAVKV